MALIYEHNRAGYAAWPAAGIVTASSGGQNRQEGLLRKDQDPLPLALVFDSRWQTGVKQSSSVCNMQGGVKELANALHLGLG